jgi:predicted MFS family arabinose efflux permease
VSAPAPDPRRAIAAFLFSNFVIGTGVVLLSGMVNDLAAGLQVSMARAGLLTTAAAVVMAIGAPALASLTSHIDRRRLLVAALLGYAVGHLMCALAPDFGALVGIRAVAMLGAAVFTPQAAATIGLMVSPAQRASALTTILLGWSLASVAGMPIGSLIGAHVSWRAGFGFVALLALVAAIWVARVTPRGLKVPPVSIAAWRLALGNRLLMMVLAVTLVSAAAQFVLMTFLAPALALATGGGPNLIAAMLVLFGLFGLAGNVWLSRNIGWLGTDRSVAISVALMLAGLVCWGLIGLAPSLAWPLLVLALTGWGLGCFATNSGQQARLAAIAPGLASVSIALNTSCMYAAQAIGSTIGGATLVAAGFGMLPWVGAAMMCGALGLSLAATRRARAQQAGGAGDRQR